MTPYLNLLQHVLSNGKPYLDRTGTGARGVFAHSMRFNLADGFPLLTTKKIHFRSVLGELLWFLHGKTNVRDLHKYGVTIWDEWADKNGELGPVYGAQWRSWKNHDGKPLDQIRSLLNSLQNDPYSRRHIVSAWNVADLPLMALPPCHLLFQMHVSPPPKNNPQALPSLSCAVYQRSADVFLGVPFNIASYALLTHMIAAHVRMSPNELILHLGDAHLYDNHLQQAQTQLKRSPSALPSISLNGNNLFSFTPNDVSLQNYNPQSHIPAPIAVLALSMNRPT